MQARRVCEMARVSCTRGLSYDRAIEYVERIREKVPNFQLYVLALGIDGTRRAELKVWSTRTLDQCEFR